jgi:hypothetical protein
LIAVVYTLVVLAVLAGLLYVAYRIGVNKGDRNYRELTASNRALRTTLNKVEVLALDHQEIAPELYVRINDEIRKGKELA